MRIDSVIQKNCYGAGLENLNRQLQSMEKILLKADEYNDNLAKQINKLRVTVSGSQEISEQVQLNDQEINTFFNEDKIEGIYAKLIPKLASIENDLFVTANLFIDYKRQVRDKSCVMRKDDNLESNLCNRLNVLGTNLISVGNQITALREGKFDNEHTKNNLTHWLCNGSSEKDMHWTHCNTHVQDMMQMSQFTVLRKDRPVPFVSQIYGMSVRQIRCHKKIIQSVENLLAKAELSNIRSEALINVKRLAKIVLSTLVKRNRLCKQFCTSRDASSNQRHNPYL